MHLIRWRSLSWGRSALQEEVLYADRKLLRQRCRLRRMWHDYRGGNFHRQRARRNDRRPRVRRQLAKWLPALRRSAVTSPQESGHEPTDGIDPAIPVMVIMVAGLGLLARSRISDLAPPSRGSLLRLRPGWPGRDSPCVARPSGQRSGSISAAKHAASDWGIHLRSVHHCSTEVPRRGRRACRSSPRDPSGVARHRPLFIAVRGAR